MNKNLLETLVSLDKRFGGITEQSIVNTENEIVGWNYFINDTDGKTISGGTSSSKETALRIGIAEAFERGLARKCWASENFKKEFLLDEFQSTCGFASGFDDNSTRFRAICEGLERWAWSNWIDYHCHLPDIAGPKSLNPLTKHLLSQFQDCRFYAKDFKLKVEEKVMDLRFSLFLGFNENGIFPGSRVTTAIDNPWEHSLIEAYRNLKNYDFFKNCPETIDQENIIALRSHFFAKNKNIALEQINKATKTIWNEPEVLILKRMNTEIPSVFFWRCILKDFVSWDIGDYRRFVY